MLIVLLQLDHAISLFFKFSIKHLFLVLLIYIQKYSLFCFYIFLELLIKRIFTATFDYVFQISPNLLFLFYFKDIFGNSIDKQKVLNYWFFQDYYQFHHDVKKAKIAYLKYQSSLFYFSTNFVPASNFFYDIVKKFHLHNQEQTN